jgi:hypothetical protein
VRTTTTETIEQQVASLCRAAERYRRAEDESESAKEQLAAALRAVLPHSVQNRPLPQGVWLAECPHPALVWEDNESTRLTIEEVVDLLSRGWLSEVAAAMDDEAASMEDALARIWPAIDAIPQEPPDAES